MELNRVLGGGIVPGSLILWENRVEKAPFTSNILKITL
jgi:hypothetical protein